MAYSIKTYAGIGSAGAFTTPEYLDPSHIEVYVEDVLKTVNTHYTITGTTVSFTAGNFPTSSNTIKIIRKSSQSTRLVDYTDGAVEVAATFDEDSKQSLFMAQEALDGAEATGTTVFQPLEVAPSTPLEGTVYYDASSDKLQFWNGSSFIAVADDAAVVKITGDQTVAGAKTFTSNVEVTGTVTADGVALGNNERITLGGESDGKLEIYESTGGNGFIEQTGDGNLSIKGQDITLSNNANQTLIKTILNTAQLFHRNGDNEGLKLETTNTGIDVTGEVKGDSLTIDDSNSLNTSASVNSSTGRSNLNVISTFEGTVSEQEASIEIGANKLAFIDFKTPDTDDYDLRVYHSEPENLSMVNSLNDDLFLRSGGKVALQHAGANTKLETTATGIDVTGTVAASDGLTADYIDLTGGKTTTSTGAICADKIRFSAQASDEASIYASVDGLNTSLFIQSADDASDKVRIVAGGTEALTVYNAGINVNGTVTADGVTLGDNDKLQFGDDSTKDLQIYHNGEHSIIEDVGTGNLVIRGANIELKNASNKNKIFVYDGADGAVRISHGNDEAATLITTSTGIDVTGTVTADGVSLGDNEQIQLGASGDLKIYHNGSHSKIEDTGTGNLVIEGNEVSIKDSDGNRRVYSESGNSGSARLYYGTDSNEKLATTSTGIDVTGTVNADGVSLGDNEKIQLGATQDLELFHDGTNSYVQDAGDGGLILNTTSGNGVFIHSATETMGAFHTNGAVNLYHDNVEKFATTDTGIDVTGTVTAGGVTLDNNQKIKLGGAATPNLEIYETTAGHGLIVQNGAGNLVVKGQNGYLQNDAGNALVAWDGNHSELSWQGATGAGVKLATTDTGIEVTGTVEADDLKLPLFDSTSVTTNGSLDPVQVPYASTQDTLALLAVDPSGNVVKGSQEATWTFTKAQLDALTTSTTSGITLLSAAGSGKAVIVEESNWMIKYSGTGTMSANGFEVRQAHNGASDAGITRIPSGQINTIMSGLPTGNPSYGFYSRDLPQYNNDGRSYVTNKETFLTRITTNATPANLISISIKLKYRVFDVDTF